MIENEMKLMLSKEEFEFIVSTYKLRSETITQINYYYDTDDLEMNRKGITCRIREIGDYLSATMKDHTDIERGISHETSFPVYRISDTMNFFGFHLKKQGCLITQRTNLKVQADIMVTLDKNVYLDTEDYELEIEYDEDKVFIALDMLKELSEMLYFSGIISSTEDFLLRSGEGMCKSRRFFNRKVELQK